MEIYAQLVSLLSALLSLPRWDAASVSGVLKVKLVPIASRVPARRSYVADLTGPAKWIELDHPTYGGKLGWFLSIKPAPAPLADPMVVLAPLLRSDASWSLPTPPMPEWGGPAISRHTRTVHTPQGDIAFSFEGDDYKGPLKLTDISIGRPPPSIPPEAYAPDQFRAYSLSEGNSTAYVLERASDGSEAVHIQPLIQDGRVLRVSFLCKDPMIDRDLAQALIRKKLLEGHLHGRFKGKVQKLEFTDLEIGTHVEVPWSH